MQEEDVAINKSMGRHGADHLLAKCGSNQQVRILTHCNTGSLATAGYGTALGKGTPYNIWWLNVIDFIQARLKQAIVEKNMI